jgi:outer membrane receptor protein involved in Fe transport
MYSQEPGQETSFEPQRRPTDIPGLYGKVVDSKTNKGIEAASVQVFGKQRNASADTLIAGMLTKPNGDFAFPNLKLPDSFSVVITALGYSESSQPVTLEEQRNASQAFDLGNIKLANEADMLGSVTVVAQRPTMQMGIDRRVFNVDKNITSTGGTAVDVMRNIPSLTVDAEGNVALRNTTPQIFVDGRPTILTLEQIPADDIERVELITNPSAKFDAASSGGIINVVLKKNKKLGFNGLASAGIGTPDILTGNLSLNMRKNKINFFATGSYNQSGGVAKSESFRQNKDNGIITDFFNQQSENERSRKFTNIRFGIDYFIDNRNTISASQNFVNGRFKNFETQDQQYLNNEYVLTQTGERTSDNAARFNRSVTQLNYTHEFPKNGMELTADITYSTGDGNNRSLISNYLYNPDGSSATAPSFVRNSGENTNENITIQVDFVNPISENAKIEMGLRRFQQDNSNIFNAFSLGSTEVKLPLSTNVRYDESVSAAYVTFSNKLKSFSYQLGLRGEYTEFNGELVDSAQKFGYRLPLDVGNIFDGLFPSIYLSKEIGEGKEVQLNFSRRIRRPDFWQLNPFIDINDPLNISQGNPQLRPEYVNSFEFNYNNQYSKGNFLASLYFRNNVDDITRFSDTISAAQYEQLSNAAISPNAILNTFINAQFTNRMGAEFTLNHRLGGFEFIPNLNLQYRKVKAMIGDLNLSNQGFNWESKLIVNYKLAAKSVVFNNLNFQLTGEYESKEVIPQGRNKEQYQANFALRKEFLKNNVASVTFSVNDIFNTNRFGQIYDTDDFYQDSYRRWNVRNFRLTFSYRFGKKDFNMFGGNRENRSSGGDDD